MCYQSFIDIVVLRAVAIELLVILVFLDSNWASGSEPT